MTGKPKAKKTTSAQARGGKAKGDTAITDSSRMPPHMHDSTTGSP